MTSQADAREDDTNRGSRRAVLTAGMTAIAAGLAALAGRAERAQAQAPQKLAQKVVQYQDHPKGDAQCSKCVNFIAPNACKIVAGTISPNGWCIAFAPKPA
ncbi:MAG: high-potential iron-sulfur protein [Acetobacteraceae bacterium]